MAEPKDRIEAAEADAVLATSAELGPAYDGALAESFADRVEHLIEARVAEQATATSRLERAIESTGQRQMVLGIVSIVGGIPITAIAGGMEDLPGMIVAWVGIAAVNAAHALTGRRRA